MHREIARHYIVAHTLIGKHGMLDKRIFVHYISFGKN